MPHSGRRVLHSKSGDQLALSDVLHDSANWPWNLEVREAILPAICALPWYFQLPLVGFQRGSRLSIFHKAFHQLVQLAAGFLLTLYM
jgi:hypothetical protein